MPRALQGTRKLCQKGGQFILLLSEAWQKKARFKQSFGAYFFQVNPHGNNCPAKKIPDSDSKKNKGKPWL